MALTKCKECGAEISKKATVCPKCGAKAAKRTSLVTWLVLVLIVFAAYSWIESPTPSNSNSNSPVASNETDAVPSSNIEAKDTSVPKAPTWSTFSSTDEMTGESMHFAHSPRVSPTRAMSFPYSDVRAWFGVGCDSESEWAYIGFNSSPNLSDDETKDGYSVVRTRIKWDDALEQIELTQDWGDKFLRFRKDDYVIQQVMKSEEALFELQWHGEQSVYFKFSLNGSSEAISKIRGMCSS
ncbi:zinc-ribbon domain-containing protein [Pseudidiomarina sp. 1APR75-15]|uniref:Zinc-ribbon domain-containing protein n=1 Tax=Pseudidiomarina terrestris TaxID=2820060 RepID=A0ABT8MIS1_9GAMM|nr:zinc ribbon domain-containing protein [Pseudidiomarina sp. 1APR75-15]MDN7129840.1 zinc-ribbon domain-containing protein [Pseudidiomarina sp. 1APR75-15]